MIEDASITAALVAARAAQPGWAAIPATARCRAIGATRRRLLRERGRMLATLDGLRPREETLAAELLPLLDAARFLERNGAGVLAPRVPPGRPPLWLFGARAQVRREPFGVVLAIAPGNYPLFLAGVQMLQALAAGNAVCVKPARGLAAPLALLTDFARAAGIPADVVQVLSDSDAAGEAAVRAGFDRIVFTGSAATGARVLAAAGLVPCTLELSGDDAAFVLPGADLGVTARCLAYGLRLNRGETCIAPHRVFVTAPDAPALEAALAAHLAGAPPVPLGALARGRIAAAMAAGARMMAGDGDNGPAVLAGDPATLAGVTEDVFAPVLTVLAVPDMDAALALAAASPYALGASVFGPPNAAAAFAARVRAGSVVVNDLIVPTADPRLPFGGRGRSGFGVTRGAEGLLEMTTVKAVSIRRGRFRPQFMSTGVDDGASLTEALVLALHGGVRERLGGIGALVVSGRRGGRTPIRR